jgi:hypothetical protein
LVLPRGAGVDVNVKLDTQPVAASALQWLVDDASIVTVSVTSDGARLRVTGAHEGDTVVHVGVQGDVIDLPTHVASPAIVQLWIEPSVVSAPIGTTVEVRTTAIDTTSTIRDVSDSTTWELMDPGVAVVENNAVLAASAGTTTLQAVVAGVKSTVAVTVY